MSCKHSEHFKVKVHIEISADEGSAYQAKQALTYGQAFEIPSTGFTGVAKILGDLDQAIGRINKCKELTEW